MNKLNNKYTVTSPKMFAQLLVSYADVDGFIYNKAIEIRKYYLHYFHYY